MLIISRSNCIRCFFDFRSEGGSKFNSGKLNVFYAETKDLSTRYSDLKNYITNDENLRAEKFHFEQDRETYISCHAVLRLVLAQNLNVKPLEIRYKIGLNNKPSLIGDQIYFNVTHTKDAFAFAVSSVFYVGIDLEDINRRVDIHSIVKSFFSKKEQEYIFKSKNGARNRFFLLWTRKEALLKSIGTGIINNLTQIEVSEQENLIKNKSLDNLVSDYLLTEHFIYSKKLSNYWLSIATPHRTTININLLNKDKIVSYLD